MPECVDLYRFDREAKPLSGPDAVRQDAVETYLRDGFLAVDNVLTSEEVAEAKGALADLIHGRVPAPEWVVYPEPALRDIFPEKTGTAREDLVRKLMSYCPFDARLDRLAQEHSAIQAILKRLLGEPAQLIQDMALLKPPQVGTEKPWHQDMAYFDWTPPEKVIGAWIALDPATAENGCMHVLPGTHREGAVPHVHRRDCQIADERIETDRDVMVPLAPGGVLFFASMLHHGTPPNASRSRRWALQFHYAAVSAGRMNRREHAALFFDGDLYAGCRGGMGEPVATLTP
jgi:phytanoyl-CoA hydroxylase